MKTLALSFVLGFYGISAHAFDLKSNDIKSGAQISEEFVYNSFGCSGKNASPELHWTNPPKGTKSFAVTVYDPDAPTGSGFWHWIAFDIPASVSSFKTSIPNDDASAGKGVPSDYGVVGYGGPCPPPGRPHRYIFTVHALKTEKLGVPEGATNAVARFFINGATIGKASLSAKYGRK